MLVIPMAYDDMPHTEETEEVILSAKLDHLPLEGFKHYLRTSQLFCVFDKGEMVGFYLEDSHYDHVEIHCFVYPSQRKSAIPLMKLIKDNSTLPIKTYVFSCYPHIKRYLQMIGFKDGEVLTGYAFKGDPVDVIEMTLPKQ